MPTLTDKVNELASILATVDDLRRQLTDQFVQVDAKYAEIKAMIDAARPAPVESNPAITGSM